MAIKLRHQEIYDSMALGLLTHATGKVFECLGTNAVQINAVDNEYTYDLVSSECGADDTAYCFVVVINNDYIRVSNDNQKYDFTTVTYYFSGCRVAIAKEP